MRINFKKHLYAHPISEKIDSMKKIARWVKSARVFKNNVNKSGQQGIRHLLLMS